MASADTFAFTHPQQWLSELATRLEEGVTQVLITVVHTQGSTPRDTGAHMCVGNDFIVDTIGGGHLEWKAIANARTMLQESTLQCKIERYALGPSLGQCCGGVVWLLFEHLGRDDAAWCRQIAVTLERGGHAVRTFGVSSYVEGPQTKENVSYDVRTRLSQGVPRRSADIKIQHVGHPRLSAPAMPLSTTLELHSEPAPTALNLGPDAVLDGASEAVVCTDRGTLMATVTDVWPAPKAHIVVCGAGHIGHAIVTLLANLPVQVTWLDPRDDCWPSSIPANVCIVQGDADDVPDMPEHAYWLILTHNHALDLAIIEALFRQKSFSFLGLIGSKSKKARFVRQLSRRHPSELVEQICCPIGIVQTSSKLPSVIAISVVGQLLGLMTI